MKRAILFGLSLLVCATLAWAASVTVDFSGTGLSTDSAVPSDFSYAGFTWNCDGVDGWYYGPTYGVGGSPDFYTDEFNYGTTEVRFKRTDGMEIYVYDVETRGPFGDTQADLYGYRDGLQVYGPVSIALLASFETHTLNWELVDEVRILKNGANEFSMDFDNFRYDDAPTVKSVDVIDELNVDVTFNKAVTSGQLTPSNYTLSGSGQGTLAANPNSVALQSGNTYRCTWLAGNMVNGGDITITVANVQDAGAQSIGTPNSGTDTGGAVPVTLSTFKLE